MKSYIQKTIAVTALSAVVFWTTIGAYAMSDADFKKQILGAIIAEENLSPEQAAELTSELNDISMQDILGSLAGEIKNLEDQNFKTQMQKKYDLLKSEVKPENFYSLLDEIYAELDKYYADTFEDVEIELITDYDFSEEKKHIIASLKEEQKYVDDAVIKKQISEALSRLEKETKEDAFFDILDSTYEAINSHYGFDFDGDDIEIWELDEHNFEDFKKQIISDISKERTLIKDKALKAKFEATLKKLEKLTDEDDFFEILDDFYSDKALESHYKELGIEVITGEEFLDGDFDIEAEKQGIIEGIKNDISLETNPEAKKELESLLQSLENAEDAAVFFDTLDADFDFNDVFDIEIEVFDFDDERDDILEGISEEISSIKDAELQSTLKAKLQSLKWEKDEDAFFEILSGIYDSLDASYIEIDTDLDEDELFGDVFDDAFENDLDIDFDDDLDEDYDFMDEE